MSSRGQSASPTAGLRRLQHENYTIAIICPMGDELSPVLALLDEKHENLSTTRDQNAYELGRMGQHNVVVAAMPMIGNNAAAMVITQLLNDFGRVRFGLLVGVGGGIPDEDYDDDDLDDIRLGDVVVSKARGEFGGVVQFDRGKSTTGGFVRTGQLNKPPHVLASSVEKLKALHNLQGNSIPRYLDEMLDKYPYMQAKYGCPGPERDHLFEASYTHIGGKNCKKCDINMVIEREERQDSRPQIHYGTIGSSNMVIQDPQKRNELRDSMGILCVEMEAAGLIDAFPCLVIRGISDYSDSHKNKRWQPYAAATAAAYTKELLSQIPPDAVKRTQAIIDTLQGLSTRVDQVDQNTQKIERWTQSAEEREILDWLSPKDVDFSSPQNLSQRTHTPGTGQWLLEDKRYQDWRDKDPGLLWLRGAAGCGKTVLCSTIIRDLQENVKHSPANSLAYWYFRFDNSTSQDVSKMLRSIIRQLSFTPLSTAIQALRDRHNRAGSEPSLEELITALNHVLKVLNGDIYIVLDALDECPHADKQGQRTQLLRTIRDMVSKKYSKLHLLVTSRPEPDILQEISSIAIHSLSIEELIKADVAQHVEAALEESSLVNWDEEVKNLIRDKLLSFEERRFRWADLQIKRFRQCPTLDNLKAALNSIPKDLESSYKQAFDGIDECNRGHVTKILMWLALSFEPLNAKQVAAVVRFRSSDFVVKICTTLLVTIIDENTTQIIKLAHFSVREFIVMSLYEEQCLQWYRFSNTVANRTIAFTALGALLEPESQLEPILAYAARYWPQHATGGMSDKLDSSLEERINLLFDNDHVEQFIGWLKMHNPDEYSWEGRLSRPNQLYYASLLGFESAVRTLCDKGYHLSNGQGTYGNALNAAAARGSVAVVRWIFQNCSDSKGFLDIVIIAGKVVANAKEIMSEIFEILSEFDVSKAVLVAGASNVQQGEAVMHALLAKKPGGVRISKEVVRAAALNAGRGQEVMELLLEKEGEKIQVTQEVIKSAARNRGSGQQVMELLLEKKGDQIQITKDMVILLAREFNIKVVELLLEKKKDQVHITEDVIKAAAGNWRNGQQVMELLLMKKRDRLRITKDLVGVAAQNEDSGQQVMKLLLERKGHQVHITKDAIISIARDFNAEVVEVLLKKKGDQIQITEDIVKAAAGNQKGGREVMKILLRNIEDRVLITDDVIEAAAKNRRSGQEVVELLLKEKKVQIQITEEMVILIARGFDITVLELLLETNGSHVQITESLAILMAKDFNIKVVELLLEKKGDQVRITEDVIKAAAGNWGSGQQVMELLLEKTGDRTHFAEKMIVSMARDFNARMIELLLNNGDHIQITEDIVKAAAGNWGSGDQMVRLLLERAEDQVQITEDVIKAASGNKGSGQQVMELLLKGAGNKLTEEMIISIARSFDSRTMKLLLEKNGDQIQITENLISSIARRFDVKILELLFEKMGDKVQITESMAISIARDFDLFLEKKGDHIQISEEMTKAASESRRSGQQVMEMLLKKMGDQVHITEQMINAAAGDRRTGNRVVELLLKEKGDQIQITEKMVISIARNFDANIMELLLEKKGDQIQITEEVIRAVVENWGRGQQVIELLLRDADTTITDKDGSTPLNFTSNYGNINLVNLILEKGDDWSVANNDGWYPLICVVQLLLKRGIDWKIANNDGLTSLNAASSNGYTDVVKLLLEKGADWSIPNKDGWTPLNSASSNGYIDVVKLLLENGADWSIPNNDGWTPLNAASSNGYTNVVKLLLDNGADGSIPNKDGWTPLNTASSNGHVDVVKLLLKNGADWSIPDNDGWTPLNASASNGYIDVVKLLLENGAECSIPNKDGWTPLNTASRNGHTHVVKLLLDNGADGSIPNNDGWTPFNTALDNEHTDVVKLLLENGTDWSIPNKDGWTPLNAASSNGYTDVVKLLLENDADWTIANNDGWTPLNSASSNGHVDVVELLLKSGADWSIPNNDGWTPLNAASSNGHEDVVELLLESGADWKTSNNEGWTPFNAASDNGHLHVVKLLVEKGADWSIPNNDGWTPINSASDNGHIEVVKLLLENGADFSIPNNHGRTPIYSASRYGHTNVVKLLLEKGADWTMANNDGWTPLHAAWRNGNINVVRLLLEKGADWSMANNDGRTPLNTATTTGYINAMKLLFEKGSSWW